MTNISDQISPPTEAMPIIHLSEDNFNAFTLRIPSLVIDFWAEWCGPCRYFAPIFEEISLEYPEIQFCKCNTEENCHIATELRINAIPTLMFIKSGTVVRIHCGVLSIEEFREELNSVFRA
ncbi:MAG TPA: thioredoxin domain-containing protein [Methanocorpusculum sp.]|nr:thioredoxin domain-containing protein [Methanocorpusculum sp.]